MWCKKCNLETNDAECPVCGTATVEDVPVEIYWCDNCFIPSFIFRNNKGWRNILSSLACAFR